MSENSKIEWTDATWNPVRGCTKVSPGCAHCYAETFAERFRGVPGHPYEQGFDLRIVPHKLAEPLRWTGPKMVFVNSMSDLFHRDVPDNYILAVARVMQRADWHTYQVLTKRSERMRDLLRTTLKPFAELPHIWWGVSVENRKHGLPRIEHLRAAPAAVRFLSVEPLLEDLGRLDLDGIGWVITGGESGPGARPVRREWVLSILDQCRQAGVPFFFKQWGGVRKGRSGRELDGQTYDEVPEVGRLPVVGPEARRAAIGEVDALGSRFVDTGRGAMIGSLQRFGGGWTQEKLERVRKYLVAYTTIMRKYHFEYAYIDAFAGTGYRELRQDQDGPAGGLLLPELAEADCQGFLDGSARIALQVEPRFTKYIYIERDPARFAELRTIGGEYPDRKDDIVLVNEDANEFLRRICLTRNWERHRAVLFLDPFGMQVRWDTLEAIASTRAIDMWLLFPLGMAVNRLLRRDGKIREAWRRRLDLMFGEPDWYDAFYPEDRHPSLFGEDCVTRSKGDFRSIEAYFIKRLGTIFHQVADNPLPLCNSVGNPLYLLCFASGNTKGSETAVKIARDILKR
jgi:three-Cys-motif partner protein